MKLYSTSAEIWTRCPRGPQSVGRRAVAVADPARFRAEMIDSLVWTAVFGKAEARDAARHAIREAAESLGILPASILPLYEARGRGEVSGFTVPAINMRMLSYDTARAALPRRAQRSTPAP